MSLSRKLIYSFLITFAVVVPFSLLTYHLPALTAVRRGRSLLSPTSRSRTLSGQLEKKFLPQSKTVNVVARVGGYAINTLSGWTSPFAEVSLSFQGATRKTLADETGYFIFTSVPFPDIPEELCLISQDVNQLPSFPLCLAPPSQNQNPEIKDILLSPSLSLENSKISSGKTTKASGMTFPRSKIQVYLFTEKDLSFWTRISVVFPFLSPITSRLSLITYHLSPFKSAYAANFPVYETESNENGYFEFSLPSSSPSNNRLFVSAQKLCSSESSCTGGSPKSNTLSFQIMGFWELLQLLWKYLSNWIMAFRINCSNLWLIVLIETLVLIILIVATLTGKKEKEEHRTQRKVKVTD